jgi:hypothetical protein
VSDQLLVVLRICLLVFMYVVFLRILRVVWVELKGSAAIRVKGSSVSTIARAPVAVGTGPAISSQAPVLLAIEPPALAGTAFTLDAETTIGRASGCRIPIDDTHVSKVHARIFVHEGRWFVEDLGSTNGTLVNGVPADGAAPVEPGSHIRVGETVLEFR